MTRFKNLSRWILGTTSVASLAAGCGDDDDRSMRMDAEMPDGGPVTTDGGPVTPDAGPVDQRAELEAALRDACTLYVACEADVDYTVEDCIGYYAPYVDEALAVEGCAAPLTDLIRCFSGLTCESLDSDACDELETAAEAACPELDGPPEL